VKIANVEGSIYFRLELFVIL